MARRMIVLTDGFSNPVTAKLAASVIRYRPNEVVAVFDRESAGQTAQALFGVGGELPVIGVFEDAPGEANTLVLGTAPPGGKVPTAWRPIILEAIRRGMNVVSGMHEFLCDDAEFSLAAEQKGVTLLDLRKNDDKEVASGQGFRDGCLRIHSVATTTSCGKMVTAIETAEALKRQGHDAQFVATGQTGIMVAGSGCPVDRVIADFVAGSAERLVRENQEHDILLIEGQGSLVDPRYGCVTLGLLHGLRPDGLLLCYQMGREKITDWPENNPPMPPLGELARFYETATNFVHPCRVIGVGVNGLGFSDEAVERECARVKEELGLPACDVYRHGAEKLAKAVLKLKEEVKK